MKKNLNRAIIMGAMLATFAASAVVPAFAGSEGRTNTALVLTAATIFSALQKDKTAAVILGAGTVAAWNNADKARQQEQRHSRYQDRRGDNRRDNDRRLEQRREEERRLEQRREEQRREDERRLEQRREDERRYDGRRDDDRRYEGRRDDNRKNDDKRWKNHPRGHAYGHDKQKDHRDDR